MIGIMILKVEKSGNAWQRNPIQSRGFLSKTLLNNGYLSWNGKKKKIEVGQLFRVGPEAHLKLFIA